MCFLVSVTSLPSFLSSFLPLSLSLSLCPAPKQWWAAAWSGALRESVHEGCEPIHRSSHQTQPGLCLHCAGRRQVYQAGSVPPAAPVDPRTTDGVSDFWPSLCLYQKGQRKVSCGVQSIIYYVNIGPFNSFLIPRRLKVEIHLLRRASNYDVIMM